MNTTRLPNPQEVVAAPMLIQLGLFLPLLFAGAFYLSYAQHGWFAQDDFQLIMQYGEQLQPKQILDFGSFGRFLSRNAYWHYGIQLFGLHAPLFFLLNLFFICATSLLVYQVMRNEHGWFAGVVAGLVYFCMPGTIESYVWLSNSQHLLGHLFVMVFVYLFTTRDLEDEGRKRVFTAAMLVAVVLFGLCSNIFMGMVLSLPLWLLVADPSYRKNRWNYVVPVLGMALFLYFYARLSGHQTGAYATSLSIGTFWTNAKFYFKGDAGAWVWLVVVLGGATYSWLQGRLFGAWLFMASAAFLLPFAFLEHQRYGSYSALPHLFFVLGCWSLACHALGARRPRLVQYIGASILALVLVQSLALPIRYYGEHPNGKAVRDHAEQLRLFDARNQGVRSYCFRGDKQVVNTTGVLAWDMPAEWWQVGFGAAFLLFVNGQKTYELVTATSRCDATFVFRDQRLELVPR